MAASKESFYVSGGFWVAVAAVIVTIIIGALTVWMTWQAANPKRGLLYGMPVITPLLNAGGAVRQGLEVHRGGQVLQNPYVLEIKLTNKGRLDISEKAFSKEKPLRLDVGASILEILNSTTNSGYAIPATAIDGCELKIGPDLIRHRQSISYSLLVDGPEPKLTRPPHPLIDIPVDVVANGPTARSGMIRAMGVDFAAVTVMVAAVVTASLVVGATGRSLDPGTKATVVLVAAIAAVMAMVAVLSRPRR